jgi:hypothetical protein
MPPENATDFPIRDAFAAAQSHYGTGKRYRSGRQDVDEAFWRTLIADREGRHRPANKQALHVWTLYFQIYDAIRSGKGKEEIMDGPLKGTRDDDEAWDLRRIFTALWFWQSDDEDLFFSHMLASDLSKRWPEHKHALVAAQVLNRSFDTSTATEPRMSAGRQFCITAKGHFGLVPKLTAIGDMVVLLDGARTPHVVRHSDDRAVGDEQGAMICQLAGECFIHEGMDGQLDLLAEADTTRKTFWLQ